MGGYARFDESDVDARLTAFWDAYTWVATKNSEATDHAVLKIRYVKLI